MKLSMTTALGALLLAGLSYAADQLTADKIASDITVEGLRNTLQKFEQIARDNNGNRAHGTSGYNASRDFIVEHLEKQLGDSFDFYVQKFTFDRSRLPSWNIIAETKLGDPNNVVMLGAHLDGVRAGPGINDDGSGSAAILEIATSLKNYTGLKNKIRFGWWGAEELGLYGSIHYVDNLNESEKAKIRFYFNYDMIGSIRPDLVVYSNNAAHMYGAKPLFEYLTAAGASPKYERFDGGSDYVPFVAAGIPSSGIFTGIDNGADPCYHRACDDLTNINWDIYEKSAKAAASVSAKLALSLDGAPPRGKPQAQLTQSSVRWRHLE
ncbi:aminopeptidase Y [Cordyceps fumosorosea ARSEF 2679]|uniref:Peptide hydrolase n=1 Tax=Cordyceps fumosorosea (strain ARSEF 2679) TaxID=1081104 RepID=A0A167NNK7_CORFA|nr:aminopeptidase Y [Cordyceps fumosorosea ARSEF 2679]OAA55757.1 aminopeptidase Y [Cordyceps fumosorosea ARSEF 2679]